MPEDTPPMPQAFGIALLTNEIKDNTVSFVWSFVNRSNVLVQVDFLPNSHAFDVVIENAKGVSWHINDFMEPPPSVSLPVSVQPQSESVRVLPFAPAGIPGLDLVFVPEDAPYKVKLKLNSNSYDFQAIVGLKFAKP